MALSTFIKIDWLYISFGRLLDRSGFVWLDASGLQDVLCRTKSYASKGSCESTQLDHF